MGIDERGTFRRLEIAPKGEPGLWRSTVLADFFWFSHDVKSLKVGLEIGPQVQTSLKCQLANQKILKPWHEFSKLFKDAVNVVYVNFWPTGIVI